MSNFEVKIQPIFITPHSNANALELGNIGSPDGWQVIVAKGKFQTGNMVAYIGENAVVPEWVLKKYGYWNEEQNKGILAGSKGDRVKAIRLRGEFSLGIVIPVREITTYDEDEGTCLMSYMLEDEYVEPDENVADLLGVTKYEPPIPVELAGEVYNSGQHIGVNYDIENIKNYPDIFVNGEEVQITEKIHGCVHPATKIMLPNGEEVSIGDIIENEKYTHILSYDVNTSQFIPKRITGKLRRPNTEGKKWIKITLSNGRFLRITEDHPVFSEDRNCYIEAKNIIVGENIKDPF